MFFKAGEKTAASQTTRSGLLQHATSWEMRGVDLRRKPPDVVHTNLRQDIVIWSTHSRKIILIDLTVPC